MYLIFYIRRKGDKNEISGKLGWGHKAWWLSIDPLTVATIEALENNYDLFHEFYSTRIRALETCLPHEGHSILAKWEQRGLIKRVATQNVDGLQHQALSNNVDQLHGSILTYRCHECDK